MAKDKDKELVWEKRILFAAFATGILATLLFLIAYSTEYWVYVHLETYERRNDSRGVYLKEAHYHGLWTICRKEHWYIDRNVSNDTKPFLYCRPMYFSIPDYITDQQRRENEGQMLHFRRSTVVIGFIALFVAVGAHCFGFYSIGQLRYVYKRLAGVLELIAAGCSWITLEVFRQSIKYEEKNMKYIVPESSKVTHGWSFNLIWVTLILYLFPGVALLVFSRKRKGRKARSMKEARENEPVNLGRI